MADTLVKAISSCGHFRAVAAITTDLVEELRKVHHASAVATAALGRAVTGAVLLASDLKDDERVMIQVLGDGPIKEIYVEADPKGRARGYVGDPNVDLPIKDGKIPVGEAVGKSGTFTVVKDLGLREPYKGVVPITSGELGKDLAYYLTVSEQVPSAVAVGVYLERDLTVGAAGGYLVQTLPGATEEEIGIIEKNIMEMAVPTELIRGGVTPKEVILKVMEGLEMKFLGEQQLMFHCPCSRERVSEALIALGTEDLEGMVKKGEKQEVMCEFCRKVYCFDTDDIRAHLKEAVRRGESKI
jgi:molecular chaperone Hsp33